MKCDPISQNEQVPSEEDLVEGHVPYIVRLATLVHALHEVCAARGM